MLSRGGKSENLIRFCFQHDSDTNQFRCLSSSINFLELLIVFRASFGESFKVQEVENRIGKSSRKPKTLKNKNI